MPHLRITAIAILILSGGCTPDRIPNLDSPDPYERALGVLDLEYPLPDAELERKIPGYLDDPHPLVRDSAMIVMSELGLRRYAGKIVPFLRDPHEQVRVRACITLGEMKVEITRADVAKALREDASPNVRREAVRALAEFGPQPDVLAALLDGVRDKHPSVRYNSHEMLRRLTKRDDVPRDAEAWEKVVGTR